MKDISSQGWLSKEPQHKEEGKSTGGDEHPESVRSIFKESAETTTIHGIGNIISARYRYQRVIWLIVVLGLTGYLAFQMNKLFSDFLKHPVQTSVKLQFRPLPFPAVSFCNMNAVRKSKVNLGSSVFQDYVAALQNGMNVTRSRKKRAAPSPPPSASSALMSSFSSSHSFDASVSLGGSMSSYYIDCVNNYNALDCGQSNYGNNLDLNSDDLATYSSAGWVNPLEMDESVFAELQFQEIYMNENLTQRKEMGHKVEEMLVSCSFNGKKCFSSDFKQFTTADYGNCYTLESDTFLSRRTGPSAGLKMTINIQTDEYMTTEAFGVRLVIHESGSYPFPLEEGITLDTGFETIIGLKMTEITRLQEPYGECDDGKKFKKLFGISYTRSACITMCKHTLVLESCKCRPQDSAGLLSNDEKTDVKYCSILDPVDNSCETMITEMYARGEVECVCKNPCKQVQYLQTMSGREWPNKRSMSSSLMDRFCKMDGNNATCILYNNDKQYFGANYWESLSDNFLRVSVYYEDLNYEQIAEEPLYSIYRFISDIGGTLGLFIGASLVSFVELVQLVLSLCNYWRRKVCCKAQVDRVTSLSKCS